MALIRTGMERSGVGVRRYERDHGLRPWALRGLLDPSRRQAPSIDRAAEICTALGLELYIGPPRNEPARSVNTPENSQIAQPAPVPLPPDLERQIQSLVRAAVAAGGDPIPPDLRPALLERRQVERKAAPAAASDLVLIPFAQNVRLSAGPGEPVWDETEEMAVLVARAALKGWARPDRLRCARVAGDSMAPTIRDGDLAAIDRGRVEPINGQTFAVRTDEGLAVKRLQRIDDRWHLTSDNADYPPRPVTGADRILGQVAWTGPPVT